MLALALGVILLCAGVLLFVSAHWDQLSPVQRMALVIVLVSVFHVGGAATAGKFEGLSIALHTVGTVVLGAGIALTGQIFHLSEHWPAAALLWAIGAGSAWALLRHWTQGALTAILIPFWLSSEWAFRMSDRQLSFDAPIWVGISTLALTYLAARRGPIDSPIVIALCWLGTIALLPSVVAIVSESTWKMPSQPEQTVALMLAVCIPLGLAAVLRGREVLWNAVAAGWVLALFKLAANKSPTTLPSTPGSHWVSKSGLPRPLRLGKKKDGVLTPLDVR